MSFRGLPLIAAGTMLGVAAGVGSMLYVTRPLPLTQQSYATIPAENSQGPEGPDYTVVVDTVRPKRDKTFSVASNQSASVEAYCHADLRARAAGVVKYVSKAVGGSVARGELLVEIDVPDLLRDVAHKEAMIDQRRQELLLAKAKVKDALAQLDVVRANVEQQEMLAEQTRATQDLSAVAARDAARAAVRKGRADFKEKEASLEVAWAAVALRQSLIEVARKDRDRTRAMADYARLCAPFDGVIVRRDVDPGTFVPNPVTGAADPLVSVARTDIVTVVARLPDDAAPLVSTETEVSVSFDELPGVVVEGRITRYSPSVRTADRTMRLEMDVFNGTRAEYQKFLAQCLECRFAPLLATGPLSALAAAGAGRERWGPRLKCETDPFPAPPPQAGPRDRGPRLLPGMSARMRINLEKLGDAYLLPGAAVFTRGGKPFVMEVRNGVVHQVPVRVPFNDGRIAKVSVIAHAANARTGTPETLHELTGTEEIVAGRQGELTDGQTVHTTQVDW
jgi:multidrug efflux pump subunit AcrA (membrane-fusion protein)